MLFGGGTFADDKQLYYKKQEGGMGVGREGRGVVFQRDSSVYKKPKNHHQSDQSSQVQGNH